MTTESYIRILAGTVVLTGLALGHWVNEWWLLLSAFAALNLIQSAFTGFCPPEILLRKLGVPSRGCGCAAPKDRQAP
ncbi:MAG TPA: DUF2892 domain-containing protein [Opitutaceae bacterium]|jgi:hypothetical protein|nr:MAG: hypothetical protein BWX86_00730 [Verrucomicrobia bacterium ADurb.Bin122]HOD47149.1 DUF2892 domain-containing protein [Opitutaceae bacterium]HOF09472.1 DUF2892 domain-containing protein [Opitutaceae bacterium]HOG93253.1 DUF2892 domain-containing protein [Opitutaceae bacterium]HOR24559.1 DUF2892 domain-containing protein [Opitutaceae bacterium]